MNIKKVFASLTGVLMLATTVTPLVTGAASYGAELEGAYKYAFEKGITTMPSIDSANMYGEITRGQLAKMISNWAEAELGQKADATKVCSFTDEGTAEGDLAMYLKKSCQMGLMGQGIAAFRPNAKVTRGEFGTTLSRALWGGMYEGGNPYYANHLMALRDAGIMTRIETPSQLEIRGYVMLMLQRAVTSKKDTTSCTDPMIMLACSVGGENCPAACKKVEEKKDETTVVKAGDLKVTATPATERKVIINATSDLDTIKLAASEAISLDKVVLERYGYSSADLVDAVWLENAEGVKITNERGLSSKDEVSLTVNRDYRKLAKNDQFTIVVRTTNSAVTAGTLGFKVKAVESSAKNVDLSNYTPFQYDVVRYDGTKLALAVKGKSRTYHYAPSKMYEVSRLQVKASNAAILAKGFTLKNDPANGSRLDLDRYLDKVEVLVDGKAVNGLKYTVKRDELSVSFDDVKIEIRKNANFVVNVSLKGLDRFGSKVALKLENNSDFNAIEEKTRARATIETTLANLVWNTYTFNGSEIRLSNTKLAGTIDAAKGSTDVVIGEGKIEVADAVTLNDFTFVADKAGIEAMKVKVGAETFDADKINATTFRFRNVIVEKSATIKFLVDLDSDAAANITIAFDNATFSRNSLGNVTIGTYDESGEKINATDFVGSITLSKVRLQPAKGSLQNAMTKEVEYLNESQTRKTVFEGEYTAQRQAVSLNEMMIKGSAALAADETVTFFVSIDGKEVGMIDLRAGEREESTTFSEVALTQGQKAKVKVEADVFGKTGNSYVYTLTLKGQDKDGNEAGVSSDDMVKIKIVSEGAVDVASQANVRNTVVLRATNTTLAKFTVKSANNSADSTLSSVEFALTNNAANLDKNNLRIRVGGNDVDVTTNDVTIAGGVMTLSNLNESISDGGVDVEIVSRPELAVGDYGIKLAKVNGKAFNREFNKKVVDALVSISKQEDNKGTTRFTFKVEKADENTVVSNLVLKSKNTQIGQTLAEVNNGDSIEVAGEDSVQLIDTIEYNDGAAVSISNTQYADFFKLDGTVFKVFRA